MTKISTRQVCFIMLMYTVVSKILLYPTYLSNICERDLLFPAAINFAVQIIVVWAVSYLSSRTDKTFYELLENTFGKVLPRVVYALFALLFAFAAIVPLFEQKMYVHAIFYDSVSSLAAFFPFFFFAVYAGGKGFKNIGRCADICLPVFIAAMAMIFSMSVSEVEPSNVLPILKSPVKNIFGGALGTVYAFIEPCWLLMFLGNFKHKKGDTAKITLSYAGGAAIVMLVLFVFYGIYGDVAKSRTFAVSKIALFFPAIEVIGRIDLIALYILEIVMLFAVVLNIQLSAHCIVRCTDMKEQYGWAPALVVSFVLALILILCNSLFSSLYGFFNNWAWTVFIPFTVIIPLLAWALKRREKP